jgi:hypothetical protein
MGPSLATLANELLGGIASYLGQSDLYSFALICRNTKASGYEALYQVYENIHDDRPFALFLRTLCQRTDLAEKVKGVRVRAWGTERRVFDEYMDSIPSRYAHAPWMDFNQRIRRASDIYAAVQPRHMDLFYNLLAIAKANGLVPNGDWSHAFVLAAPPEYFTANTAGSHHTQLVRSLWNEVEDAQMLVMLSMLPNLRSLNIQRVRFQHHRNILDWSAFNSDNIRLLRSLRTLNVEGKKLNGVTPVFPMSFFNGLEHLEKIRLKTVATADRILPAMPLNSTKNLSFQDVRMSPGFVRATTSCGCVEQFDFSNNQARNIYTQVRDEPGVLPIEIFRSLLLSKDTLTRLSIVNSLNSSCLDFRPPYVRPPTGYMAQLENLTHLRIDQRSLLQLSGIGSSEPILLRDSMDLPFDFMDTGARSYYHNSMKYNTSIVQILREQLPRSLL